MYLLIVAPLIDLQPSIVFCGFSLIFYDVLVSFIGSVFGISRVYSIFCCKPGVHVAIYVYIHIPYIYQAILEPWTTVSLTSLPFINIHGRRTPVSVTSPVCCFLTKHGYYARHLTATIAILPT